MWWFYTVILGMSFGQVLQELALSVREWARSSSRPYLPAALWQIFLLVLIVEVWLAVTYYRDTVTTISVAELVAFLAVPEARLDSAGELTAAAAFDRVRPIFFGVLIAIVVVNLVHGVLRGEQALDVDLLFQALIVAGALTGLLVRSGTADTVLAAAMIAVVALYIAVGYSTVEVNGAEAAAPMSALGGGGSPG